MQNRFNYMEEVFDEFLRNKVADFMSFADPKIPS